MAKDECNEECHAHSGIKARMEAQEAWKDTHMTSHRFGATITIALCGLFCAACTAVIQLLVK